MKLFPDLLGNIVNTLFSRRELEIIAGAFSEKCLVYLSKTYMFRMSTFRETGNELRFSHT